MQNWANYRKMPHGWLWDDSSSPWHVLLTLCLLIKSGLFLSVDTLGSYRTQATQPQPYSAGANFKNNNNNNANLVPYACWAFGRAHRVSVYRCLGR